MTPKTRLDRLVLVRERWEENALDRLARAQLHLGRAAERLATVRLASRADGRSPCAAALWEAEESAHHRTLLALRAAERDLAKAHQTERVARAAYEVVWRDAEAARKVQKKKQDAIAEEEERQAQRADDDVATQMFNARR